MSMIGEWIRIWNVVILVSLKVVYRNSHGEAEKNHRILMPDGQ